MDRRHFLKAAAALGVVNAAGAFSFAGMARAQATGVLKFVPQADLAVIDPFMTAAFVTRNHAHMVFDQLYGVDAQFRPKPQMAAGHVIEEDGTLWRITLRDGLMFHDGEPVLARDAVASIKRWMARDTWGKDIAALVAEMSAPTDKEIRVKLQRPYRLLADALGKSGGSMPAIVPARLAEGDPAAAMSEIIGSGPYRFDAAARVPGAMNVYTRFEGYAPRPEAPEFTTGGKRAVFERVEWLTMPDATTAASALQSGEVDWWEQPTADLLPLFSQNEAFRTAPLDPYGLNMMLRLNHLHPPFDKPAVRRALVHAIRQKDYLIAAMGVDEANWISNVGFFQPSSPLASDVGLSNLHDQPDFEAVKKELKEAGYNGEPVVMLVPTDFPVLNAMSEVARDMMLKIGLNLDYQTMDWGTQVQRLNSKEAPAAGGWSIWANYASGAGAMNPVAHTYLRGHGANAIWGWPSIPAIEALRAEWINAASLEDEKRICAEIQEVAFQEVPYVPLGIGLQPMAYSSELTDLLAGFPIFWNVTRA